MPLNEAERLAALRRYGILDSPPEPAFDDITRLAARACLAPIAVINLIDAGRQWSKSDLGLGLREIPLDASICAHTILRPGLFVVRDTLGDARFAHNPFVAGQPHLRFYAGAPLITPDGHALGTLCVFDHAPRDLSDEQKDTLQTLARQAMAQLELRYRRATQAGALDQAARARALPTPEPMQDRLLFDHNPLPMWVFDQDTLAFLDVNQAAVERYGYSRQEFLSMTLEQIGAPEAAPALERTPPAAPGPEDAGVTSSSLRRHRRKNGELLLAEVTMQPIEYRGRAARLVLAHDVTKRTRAEEQLREAHKLQAVGRLAGGVAHEVNNMMTVVIGFGDFVLKALGPGHPQRANVEEMIQAATRSAGITRQLLAFGQQQLLQPTALNLNAVVTELAVSVERSLRSNVQLGLRLSPAAGQVRADRGQLEHVLMNLALNARDAMPDGGFLTIETAQVVLDSAYALEHSGVEVIPGPYAMLAMTDTGHGMNTDIRMRAFEPFFTTKPVGEATGLGLSSVYGIVKQSGGYIWIYSEPGYGTSVKVYLPLVGAPVGVAAVGATSAGVVPQRQPSVRSDEEAGHDAIRA